MPEDANIPRDIPYLFTAQSMTSLSFPGVLTMLLPQGSGHWPASPESPALARESPWEMNFSLGWNSGAQVLTLIKR